MFKVFSIVFSLFCFNLSSQTFYKQFGTPSVNERGDCLIALPDGNVIVGGSKADSAFLMKVSPDGNAVWTRTLKPQSANPNIILNFSVTPDNYILGTGVSRSTSGTNYRFFYFKVDLNGNFQWIKSQTGTSSIYLRKMLYLIATEYIAFGSTYDVSGTYADPNILLKCSRGLVFILIL